MNISIEKLERFVRQIQDAYGEESFLQEYVNFRAFDSNRDNDREFIQIGRRTNLPKEYFSEESNNINQVLSGDFAKTIARGEKRFVLSEIEEQANNERISQISVDEFNFNTIVQSYGEVYEPDYLFLPNKTEYRESLFEWRNNGYIESDFRTIVMGQSKIEINWIPTNLEIDGGFLFNSDSINVIQKRYQDANQPDDADFMPNKDWCSEDDLLMAYFGSKFRENPDEFDFWIRSIISKPIFGRGRICHLNFTDS